MQTSERGLAALEREEGVVLRAYRDVVGVWTIGAGLTAASGVIKPAAGMVITPEEATRLTVLALRKNYEPAVEVAMSVGGATTRRPKQHEFDAGVSFHWNTGAIRKASWVKRWKEGAARTTIAAAFMLWVKGGGKVIPGLVNRRSRELAMLMDGIYPAVRGSAPAATAVGDGYARWGLELSSQQKANAGAGFRALGYAVGDKLDGVLREGVLAFQRDHALTVDGIVGRATLSTLQRQIDARARVKVVGVAAAAPMSVAALPAGTTALTDQIAALPFAGPALIAGGALYALVQAFAYRDAIAAKIQRPLPRLAALLRSI